MPILSCLGEGNIVTTATGKVADGRGGVIEPGHAWTFQAREPGDPHGLHVTLGYVERSEKVTGRTSDMNAVGKSDDSIVPAKRTNKTGTPAADSVEERGSPKGNVVCDLLAPDTVPKLASHRRARPRQVEIIAS